MAASLGWPEYDRSSIENHRTTTPAIEGLTNDQLFFVSWGQVWCSVASEEYERRQVTTDPHAPARFRVNGPLALNEDFAEAFSCEAGSKMVPENRCVVW